MHRKFGLGAKAGKFRLAIQSIKACYRRILMSRRARIANKTVSKQKFLKSALLLLDPCTKTFEVSASNQIQKSCSIRLSILLHCIHVLLSWVFQENADRSDLESTSISHHKVEVLPPKIPEQYVE